MSYDKCGAASVAGFFKILAELKPKNFKAKGVLAVTRNNCGEEGYVTDEILKSRAGVRVRVGNTDAEGKALSSYMPKTFLMFYSIISTTLGRLAIADSLCYMKELAVNAINPYLFTIATLTGHAARTYGPAYTVTNHHKSRLQQERIAPF